MNEFMKQAVEEALKGVRSGDGGPFGAVIVKDGKVIASGHNRVVGGHDPTAHAEIVVIRRAAALLKRFDLSDCELYTTCEPCPMCYSAIMWAKIRQIYYGATKNDAKAIGFDDELIYDVLHGDRPATVVEEQLDREACLQAFKEWDDRQDKVPY